MKKHQPTESLKEHSSLAEKNLKKIRSSLLKMSLKPRDTEYIIYLSPFVMLNTSKVPKNDFESAGGGHHV